MSLRERLTGGALWAAGEVLALRVATLGLSILAARLLFPAQLGALTIAVSVVSIISMVASCAETAAIVSAGPGESQRYGVAAALQHGVLSIVLGAGVWTFAPAIAAALATPGDSKLLESLLRLLAILPLMEALRVYPAVVLQLHLDLSSVIRASILQAVLFVSVAGALLVLMRTGPEGIAFGQLIGAGAGALWLWFLVWRRGLGPVELPGTVANARTARTAAQIVVGGFSGFFSERVDNLLLGATSGPAILGYYALSWNISRVPLMAFARVSRSVLIPALSSIRDDAARREQAVAKFLLHTSLLTAPLWALLVAAAPSVIVVVFGERWLPAANALRIMTGVILAAPVLAVTGAVFTVFRKPHWGAIPSTVILAVQFAIIPPLASRWGHLGAAAADAAVIAVLTVIHLALAEKLSPGVASHCRSVLGPFACGGIAAILGALVTGLSTPGLRMLAAQAAIIAIAYGALLKASGYAAHGRETTALLLGALGVAPERLGLTPHA